MARLGEVVFAVTVDEVLEGGGGKEDFFLVYTVATGADEGAFDVGAEGFGTVFAAMTGSFGGEGGEDLFAVRLC